ncbi:hypothetical protein LX64_05066 [Chitinophaga skermanii]|uniref:Uncharacterized protein n=1 Tax=Chitinophaga skermanii TaxID=331697 RepID=A0A327PZK2_9BACT|nr:hypothetical protein [Chitinophaga skermanii]RAI97558.1 hypothetical protein LX64_05066 [Chitinophaga skermanii]
MKKYPNIYFHVFLSTNNFNGAQEFYELDNPNLEKIKSDIILPFVLKQQFSLQGQVIDPKEVTRIMLRESQLPTAMIMSKVEHDHEPAPWTAQTVIFHQGYTKDFSTYILNLGKRIADGGMLALLLMKDSLAI